VLTCKDLINLALFYIALNLFLYFILSPHLIFVPPKPTYSNKLITTKLSTGSSAIYLPNVKAKYTIIFSHGNAEDLGMVLPLLQDYHSHGFAVLGYDYQGYGTSSGKCSEQSTYDDIKAAYEYLQTQHNVDSQNIILIGRSLGTGPSTWLAAKEKVGGVILEAPFTTTFRVITRWPLLFLDRFDNIKRIKYITSPLLVIHGRKDKIVPFWHGKELYHMAVTGKEFMPVDQAGHNDLHAVLGDLYWQKIKDFIYAER
jgi:fermentation-respiration switch protein FrsA (DUF1100 family)